MNPFVRGLVRAVAESFTVPGPILEVGSRIVPGQEDLGSPRSFFPGRVYTGMDLLPGPGVDLVASIEAPPLPDAHFGTVIALETLEHVERFWVAIEELQRVLRPDGLLFLSVPFFVHIHKHPADFWRFTPDALESLLRDFPTRMVGYYGPRSQPIGTWAIAFGAEAPLPNPAERAAFRHRLGHYARWPLGPTRRLGMLLGRALFGHRLFEGYLARDQFEFTWHEKELRDGVATKRAA